MKFSLLLMALIFSLTLLGETLTPRRRKAPKPQPEQEMKEFEEPNYEEENPKKGQSLAWKVGLRVGTPMGPENVYDKRFTTIVTGFAVTIPITQLTSDIALNAETGMLASVSRLSVAQPALEFTHFYFFFPVLARGIYRLGEDFFLEGIAGVYLRPWEYDTRDTYDGGLNSVLGVSIFAPEIGAGILYAFTPSLHGHFRLSYQFLSGGIELLL